MDVLCFDIGSGGISAARFDESLTATPPHEVQWNLSRDGDGRATLVAAEIESAFKFLAHSLQAGGPVAAVSISCFMHSFLGVDFRGAAATPVYTWLDTTDAEGLSR